MHCQTVANQPRGKNNLAYQWGNIVLACTANDTEKFKPRPTVTSRYLGLIWTAVFDAWSRYDAKAIPLYLKNTDRKPATDQTLKNKETAISYAAYRTMMEYFVSDSALLKKTMREMGFDPADNSLNPATPAGIGNLAAKSVIEGRYEDGANQAGNIPGSNGQAYADYTNYQPVNSADTLTDIKRWQPKYFADGKGGKFAPACLTPQWGKVTPLMIDSASQFRPVPPPAIGSYELNRQIEEVVSMQAHLTNQQKALIEFMRDGPKSVQQAGHWFIFSQYVSQRDKHTLDEDVKMYFFVQATAMDAFIACWDAKMYYDFARPYSLVHDYYANRVIKLWGGPEKGFIQAAGREWRPYSPDTFLCPPFPSYVSGHSTVSAACAEALRLYTGSDFFGDKVERVPGASTEHSVTGEMVTLQFASFTKTANMAGLSRVLGGYHIQSDNTAGLKLGRQVAAAAWQKYLHYAEGLK
ncbi:MAG: vanadium-dependent haloperoxidase [Chitinophagaceae bacterium]